MAVAHSSPAGPASRAEVEATVRAVLRDVLALSAAQSAMLARDSGLFGTLPELDSMAVAGLLTELEDRLRIHIDDDEVDGDLFATFGSLVDFAHAKVSGA